MGFRPRKGTVDRPLTPQHCGSMLSILIMRNPHNGIGKCLGPYITPQALASLRVLKEVRGLVRSLFCSRPAKPPHPLRGPSTGADEDLLLLLHAPGSGYTTSTNGSATRLTTPWPWMCTEKSACHFATKRHRRVATKLLHRILHPQNPF